MPRGANYTRSNFSKIERGSVANPFKEEEQQDTSAGAVGLRERMAQIKKAKVDTDWPRRKLALFTPPPTHPCHRSAG